MSWMRGVDGGDAVVGSLSWQLLQTSAVHSIVGEQCSAGSATDSVSAGAKRRQRELRGSADTNLAISTNEEVSHFVGHWMLLDRAPPVVSSLQGRAALFHLCYICAIASLDLDAEAYAQSAEEFLEERRHAFQRRQMRPGAVMAAGAGIWRRGLNDLGLTPSPGCAAPTEVMQVQRNSWQNDGRHPVETNAP